MQSALDFSVRLSDQTFRVAHIMLSFHTSVIYTSSRGTIFLESASEAFLEAIYGLQQPSAPHIEDLT